MEILNFKNTLQILSKCHIFRRTLRSTDLLHFFYKFPHKTTILYTNTLFSSGKPGLKIQISPFPWELQKTGISHTLFVINNINISFQIFCNFQILPAVIYVSLYRYFQLALSQLLLVTLPHISVVHWVLKMPSLPFVLLRWVLVYQVSGQRF